MIRQNLIIKEWVVDISVEVVQGFSGVLFKELADRRKAGFPSPKIKKEQHAAPFSEALS